MTLNEDSDIEVEIWKSDMDLQMALRHNIYGWIGYFAISNPFDINFLQKHISFVELAKYLLSTLKIPLLDPLNIKNAPGIYDIIYNSICISILHHHQH